MNNKKKNLLYIFADQWAAPFIGHMENSCVKTPNMDAFAKDSMHFTNAISSYPLCSPHRAALLTGKYPFSCGVWTNCKTGIDENIMLKPQEVTITDCLHGAGYKTAYIGKYHLDASTLNFDKNAKPPIKGWDAFTPKGERRHNVDFWYSYGAMDEHLNPHYWNDDENAIIHDDYSPNIETDVAIKFIEETHKNSPFSVILSWNPPHPPYDKVPQKYKELYKDVEIKFRDNVPMELRENEEYTQNYRNYLAAINALDDCFGKIINYLKSKNLYDDTIIVLSSDHGDCMGSHGIMDKNIWYEEAINIPLYIKADKCGKSDVLLSSQDHMPTLLDMLEIEIPHTVQGVSFASILRGEGMKSEPCEAFICMIPGSAKMVQEYSEKGLYHKCFGWRGLRTKTHTFVINNGTSPLAKQQAMLYDNINDIYQLNPIAPTEDELKIWTTKLNNYLKKLGDPFLVEAYLPIIN